VNHCWELPGDLSAAASARRRIRSVLDDHQVADETKDDAELVASELAANAIRYGTPPFTLSADVTADRIRITVSNHGGSTDPQLTEAGADSGNGRGLAIIAALAADLGWEHDGERLDVWAEVPIDSPID
jgi:serine/threonine-protein kinase RsbW